jgi:hypothetical protein
MTSVSGSSRVRRLGVLLALCLVIDAAAPAPALAWFGWLDKWSGPGPFWGLLYEVRVACFGDQSDVLQIEAAYARAQRSMRLVLARGSAAPVDDVVPALVEWLDALEALKAAQDRWKTPPEQMAPVVSLIEGFKQMAGKLVPDPGAVPRAEPAAATIDLAPLKNWLKGADPQITRAINGLAGQVIAVGGTGVFWSICSDEKERRVSIELNVNDWHGFKSEENSRFSAGTSIRMITVLPSVTWSVIPYKNADVVDLGVGAGYYAFSSAGFESVSGFIVEPLRVDLHAPSSWAAYPRTNIRRLVSMFTFRFGLTTIPGGFPADAFAPGSQDGPIPAEIVPMTGIFFNLNSLLSNPRKKTFQPTWTP